MASAWDTIDIWGSLQKGRERGARLAVQEALGQGDYDSAARAILPWAPEEATAIQRIQDAEIERTDRRAARDFDREAAPLIARNDISGAQRLAVERHQPTATVMQLMEMGRTMDARTREKLREQSYQTALDIRSWRNTPEAPARYAALRTRLVSENPQIAAQLPEQYDPAVAEKLMLSSVDATKAFSYLQEQEERANIGLLTPAEVAANGFRPGSVVQRGPDRKLDVLQAPTSGSSVNWQPMTSEQLIANNLPPGTSALIDPDTGNIKRLNGPRQYTDGQSAAAGFAARSRAAIIELRAAESDPAFRIEDTLNPATTNPAAQRWLGAARDMINAQLRRESGAAIGPSEFQSARQQYLANPLDWNNAAVRKAKYDRLNGMYRAFREQSSGAYDEWYGEPGTSQNPLFDVSRGQVTQRASPTTADGTPAMLAPTANRQPPPGVPRTAKWDEARGMWVP